MCQVFKMSRGWNVIIVWSRWVSGYNHVFKVGGQKVETEFNDVVLIVVKLVSLFYSWSA